MNNDNPFRAPSANVADVPENSGLELAGRGHRFGAAMIDGIAVSLLALPIGYMAGVFDFAQRGGQSFASGLGMAIVGFVIFVLMQSYFLKRNGQTIGKKIVGIRIVDLEDNVPSLGALLARRYAPIYLVSVLPVAGSLLALVDDLFIFKSDRRCIHDLIAKTKVVACNPRFASSTWFALPFLIVIVIGIGAAILIPMFQHSLPAKTAHSAPPKPAISAPQEKPTLPENAAAPAPDSLPPPPSAPPTGGNETSNPQRSDADLRKCLELQDPAAVIRCSEAKK